MKTRITAEEIIPPNGRMKVCSVSSEIWVGLGVQRESRKWWWWYFRHAWFSSILYSMAL